MNILDTKPSPLSFWKATKLVKISIRILFFYNGSELKTQNSQVESIIDILDYLHDFKYPILKDLRRRRKGIPLEGKRRIGEWIESAKERYRPAFNERPTLGHCSTPWVEINAALHWPIGEPGIYNKMFKYATSHLRHPTRRILAFFAVENNGASIVPLLPRYHRTAVSHFPRDRLLNGERCYTPSSYSLMRSLFSKAKEATTVPSSIDLDWLGSSTYSSHQISKKRRSGDLKKEGDNRVSLPASLFDWLHY